MNTLLDSLATSLFGIIVVFLALVSLIAMIFIISRALTIRDKSVAKKAAAAKVLVPEKSAPAPVAVSAEPAAPAPELYSGPMDVRLFSVDERTAAIIMAIVCDTSDIPANELYFKSIKALD